MQAIILFLKDANWIKTMFVVKILTMKTPAATISMSSILSSGMNKISLAESSKINLDHAKKMRKMTSATLLDSSQTISRITSFLFMWP